MSELSQPALVMKKNRNDVRRYVVTDHVEAGDTVSLTVSETKSFEDDEVKKLDVRVMDYLFKEPTIQGLRVMFRGQLDDGRGISVLANGNVLATERVTEKIGEIQSSKILSKAE